MQDQVGPLLAIGARRDRDEIDQAVEQCARMLHGFPIARGDLRHRVDLAPIVFDDRGMRDHRFDVGHVFLRRLQVFALPREFIRARLQLGRRDAGDDRVGDAFFLLVDVSQLAVQLRAAGNKAAAFFSPCQAEFVEIGGDDIRMQQIAPHGGPDPLLQDGIGDGLAVVAGAGLAVGAAAPSICRNDDDRPATAGAAQLA